MLQRTLDNEGYASTEADPHHSGRVISQVPRGHLGREAEARDNYSGEITKFGAIDLGEGWSLIAYTVKEDKHPRVELTNGVRLVHAPHDGVWEAYPIAFAEPKRALDSAIACLK